MTEEQGEVEHMRACGRVTTYPVQQWVWSGHGSGQGENSYFHPTPLTPAEIRVWIHPSYEIVKFPGYNGWVLCVNFTPLAKWFFGYDGWVLCVNSPFLRNGFTDMTAGFCMCEFIPLTKWFSGYDGWVLCMNSPLKIIKWFTAMTVGFCVWIHPCYQMVP